jgi:predicted DNA-binding protein YlxM (UPF0122 family)
VLAVHESLLRLEKLDARQARIVELRYFGSLTLDEAAEILEVSAKTVMREWKVTKAWLYGELKEHQADVTSSGKLRQFIEKHARPVIRRSRRRRGSS